MKGKIQTVLGQIDPNSLGQTLIHEHLRHGLDKSIFKTPLPPTLKNLKCEDFSLETLGWIRQYPYSFEHNMEFNDEEVSKAVREEVEFFKKSGGGAIVENSSVGLRVPGQMKFMKKLAEDTGVNIIAGTGFYVAGSQTASALRNKREDFENIFITDFLVGIDGTNIKSGIIGEIGCSWPLHSFEKTVLIASGRVQEVMHCPVIVHPGRDKNAPSEILRIFQESGGTADQLVMSHLDRTITELEDLAEFASSGAYCSFDLFGIEVSHYQLCKDVYMPSDAQRIARIHYLIEQGFGDKIVVGHDVHTKHRLMKFGGHGFSHILLNAVPMMKEHGISEESIRKILIDNPRQFLTFK